MRALRSGRAQRAGDRRRAQERPSCAADSWGAAPARLLWSPSGRDRTGDQLLPARHDLAFPAAGDRPSAPAQHGHPAPITVGDALGGLATGIPHPDILLASSGNRIAIASDGSGTSSKRVKAASSNPKENPPRRAAVGCSNATRDAGFLAASATSLRANRQGAAPCPRRPRRLRASLRFPDATKRSPRVFLCRAPQQASRNRGQAKWPRMWIHVSADITADQQAASPR